MYLFAQAKKKQQLLLQQQQAQQSLRITALREHHCQVVAGRKAQLPPRLAKKLATQLSESDVAAVTPSPAPAFGHSLVTLSNDAISPFNRPQPIEVTRSVSAAAAVTLVDNEFPALTATKPRPDTTESQSAQPTPQPVQEVSCDCLYFACVTRMHTGSNCQSYHADRCR